MMSDFCLQPPEDSGARCSTSDAILAGCILVFFHPEMKWLAGCYLLFIPMKGIKVGTVSVRDSAAYFLGCCDSYDRGGNRTFQISYMHSIS